jgi:hypothetical protein
MDSVSIIFVHQIITLTDFSVISPHLILAHNWEALMGSTEDPKDGGAVGSTLYVAALVYAGFILLCGCQLAAHRRYSRIRI